MSLSRQSSDYNYSFSRPSSQSPPSSLPTQPPISRYPAQRYSEYERPEKVSVAPNRETMNQDNAMGRNSGERGVRGQESTKRERDPTVKQVDQIVQHFFGKTVAVISQSRMTHLQPGGNSTAINTSEIPDTPSGSTISGAPPLMRRGTSSASGSGSGKRQGAKTNSWFNLTLPENDYFKTELKTWRNISTLLNSPSPSSTSSSFLSSAPSSSAIPSLVLSVYVDVSDLTPNQVLVLSDQRGRRTRVDQNLANPHSHSNPRSSSSIPRSRSRGGVSTPGTGNFSVPTVILEQWTLSFQPTPSSTSSYASASSDLNPSTSLPAVYKHSILHFRSLFTLIKALPAYSLVRKLNRSTATTRAGRNGNGLKVGCRVEVRETGEDVEGREGEIPVEIAIENGGNEEGRTTETIRFPGIETPLGTLHFTGTYRLNTDFGVEDIETLLSSRFIDEDFFRPTVNTARYREKEEAGRPGSLPIAARDGPATALKRLGTSPSHESPPITGLGPLPSYGSLSSRHQYAPVPTPQPPPPIPTSNPRPSPSPLPAPVPLHPPPPDDGTRRESIDQEQSPAISSSSRLSTYGTSVPSRGGAVEPAFISLSRARSGTNVAGIQRVTPSPSSQGGTSGIIRRTSLSGGGVAISSSPSSGSPIFRPGSYLSNPSGGGFAAGSSSPSFGPPSRQQPSSHFPPNATSTSQLTFGNRVSPLSPPTIPSGPSNLGATAPSRPIPLPSSSPSAGAVRGYSYTSTGGVGSGSFSRSYSYGRGSSGSGEGGGEPLVRRASSRLSFGAGSASIPRSTTGSRTFAPQEEEKRFINEGKPPQDAGDINDFLKFLDEKPDLSGLGNSRLGGGGIGNSTVLRKKDVDEQLKALRGSVLGFGTGGSSPSPPMPAFAVSGSQGGGGSASPRPGFGGISNLRRQTSRLSIEEEPAEYAAAMGRTSPSKDRRSPSEAGQSSDNGLTPRQPYRQLRPDIVSPPLSTTSATSTVRQPLHHLPLRSDSPMRLGIEPRLYPLPNSSTTSPLASPAVLPPFASVYPPLPYPPSKAKGSTTTSTHTEPIAFSPYISRAARLAQQDREMGDSERNSAAASVTSFSTQGDGEGEGSSSYRGEEEAVGRLELDGEELEEESSSGRGRRWPSTSREVDEEEISLSHGSRDATPIRLASEPSPYRRTAAGYFATRSHSRGARRASPPDAFLG